MRLNMPTAVVLAAAAALSMLSFAPAASANTSTAPDGTVTETTYTQMDSRSCTRLKIELGREADCTIQQDAVIGPVEASTALVEAARSSFSNQDMQQMSLAGAIYCRNWTMQRRPRDGSKLWQISQRGRHCWDGTNAWYGSYRGVAGYHECGYSDYGIFSVKSKSCTRSGNVTSQIRNSYSVTFQIPRTTLYGTFTIVYYGGRTGGWSTTGL